MEKSSSEVKKFSKEHSNKERLEQAEEIKNLRKEHSNEKRDTGEKIIHLISEIESKSISLEEAEQELENIKSGLQEYSDSKVKAFFGYFKKRTLEKELGSKASEEEKLQEDCEELLSLLYDLQEKFFNTSRLDTARNKLSEFYGDQKGLLEKYERDEKTRDVSNIIEKYNCLFVHGIQTGHTPPNTSLIKEGVDWETKLKIALSLDPTLSTSTIRRDDSLFAYWSNVGILLKGGRVELASPQDYGTYAESLKKRTVGSNKDEDIEKTINRAINSRQSGDRYNELTIADPIPAGLYIAYDSPEKGRFSDGFGSVSGSIQDDMPHEKLQKLADEMKLPIFIIIDGVPHEALYDSKKKIFNKGKEFTTREVLESNVKIEETDKAEMLESIFENSPFNKIPTEILFANAFEHGKEFYIQLIHNSLQDYGEETTYRQTGDYSQIPDGAAVRELGSTVNGGFTTKYFSYQGDLYEEVSLLRERRHGGKFIQRKFDDFNLKNGFIQLGNGSLSPERPILTIEDYFSVMTQELKKWREYVEKRLVENRPDLAEHNRNTLKSAASHILGFAEQAEVMGNTEVKEEAGKLVENIMSVEQLREITSRRLGSEGEVKITTEDLI